jgi:hypothetical protein
MKPSEIDAPKKERRATAENGIKVCAREKGFSLDDGGV